MIDFYKSVNNKWLNYMKIDDDSYKISNFDILNKKNDEKIYQIIINNNKINDFYNSYMNKSFNKKNIYDFLEIIDNIKNLNQYIYILSFLSTFVPM